jgi:predicted transglutaminase-like cysteine proteinase
MPVRFDRSAQNFATSRGLDSLSEEARNKLDTDGNGSVSLSEAANISARANLDSDGRIDADEQARLSRLLGHTTTPSTSTTTASASSPLQTLLQQHPILETNQDLINFFMKRNDNNWGKAVTEAKEYGVTLSALTRNRQGRIQTDGAASATPTTSHAPSRPTNPTRHTAENGLHIKPDLLSRLDAHDRSKMEAWSDLVNDNLHESTPEKLKKANAFFNARLVYASDRRAWGEKDYWATPYESLEKGGGDCDDFAIAKYVTLRKMGIPKEDLKLAYVYLNLPGRAREAHMVLLHQPPGESGTVLDNFDKSLKTPEQRRDLRAVFTFNEDALWMASGNNWSNRLSGTTDNLKKWQSVQTRLKEQGMF